MNIAYVVKSYRKEDIHLPDNGSVTVGQLKAYLADTGRDVRKADVIVNSTRYGRLVGRPDGYVLTPGDTLEFRTFIHSMPNAVQAPAAVAAQTVGHNVIQFKDVTVTVNRAADGSLQINLK